MTCKIEKFCLHLQTLPELRVPRLHDSRFQMMSAKEQIIRARSAEKEAAKFLTKIQQGEEKAKLAEEKRQEKGFELKKLEREWEASRIKCFCLQLSFARF